jgi:four helix bundle protein
MTSHQIGAPSKPQQTTSHMSYKDLNVWKKSIDFVNKIIDLSEKLNTPKNHFRLIEQLEAAATSIPMNIAEGKGRISKKEFCHFLMIARGSLYETMTLLEIFLLRKWIDPEDFNSLEEHAIEIAKMLNSLNNSIKE